MGCTTAGTLELSSSGQRPTWGGHDDPEPAADSTLLQKSDLWAHRSPPSGGSIVYLCQGRDPGLDRHRPGDRPAAADRIRRDPCVTYGVHNHKPALKATQSHTEPHRAPRARRGLPADWACTKPLSGLPWLPGWRCFPVLWDACTVWPGGAGGRFWNALPSEMRPGPGPGFLGSWNLSSVQDPKQMRPIVPPRDDALKTKEYPDSA